MNAKLKYLVAFIGVLAILGVLGALTSALFDLGEEQEAIAPPKPVPRPAKPPVSETVVTIGAEQKEPEPEPAPPSEPTQKPPESPVPVAVAAQDAPPPEEPVQATDQRVEVALPFSGSVPVAVCDDYSHIIKNRDAWSEKISYRPDTSAHKVTFNFLREEMDPAGTHEVVK